MTDEQFQNMINSVDNETVFKSLIKAKAKLDEYNRISCSVSGGADSDVMLDMLEKCKPDGKKINYVWFNTGLEYQATKDHIDYLEQKYNINIDRVKAIKPIPLCVKEYGVPFLNKKVSEHLETLQKRGFQWEDEPYEVLIERYPKTVNSLKWWCNQRTVRDGYKTSTFNIHYNAYLKEFLIQNPPTFKISNKCCKYAKKDANETYLKNMGIELNCYGIRKSEGGHRLTIASCFSHCEDKAYDYFRPVFWLKDSDKSYYEQYFDIQHSDCYKVWGMKRTGCCGCPYDRFLEKDLEIIQKYEPKLYKACTSIFGESYEYTRKYREFQKMMKEKEKQNKKQAENQIENQLTLDGFDE